MEKTQSEPRDSVKSLRERDEHLGKKMQWYAGQVKERIDQNKALFPRPVRCCDLHTHSRYSDGVARTVKELSQWADYFGIDLVAITDHDTIEQKDDCQAFANLTYGQEVSGDHHLLVYLPQETLSGAGSLTEKITQLHDQGEFPIIAHPCGWCNHPYEEGLVDQLKAIEGTFGIEIANGGGNIFSYFDATDAQAVRLWEELLTTGKTVFAVGNSDAHHPFCLGMVWNGLISEANTPEQLLSTLSMGHHFVSDGPFITLSVEGRSMGQTLEVKKSVVKVRIECCDDQGLAQVHLIHQGTVVERHLLANSARRTLTFTVPLQGERTYFRAECFSADGRRAYSNPLWVQKTD